MENFTNRLPAHLKLVQDLKERGYTVVIGYARKAPTAKEDTNRMTLLKAMWNRLTERSAADYIFVSVFSKARDPFNGRGINTFLSSVCFLGPSNPRKRHQ